LLWVAITGLLLVLLSMTVTGIGVYREFSSTILPLLNRPCAEPDNQCLAGAVLRAMSKQPPLPTSAQNALAIAQCLVLATILVGIFARLWNDDSPHRPAELAASVAAMTAWLLLFSPVSWDHYYVYTCGLWGWLIFEAGQTGFRRILIICIALVWPIDTAGMAGLHGNLPWPLNEHLQFGLLLMMVVALLRLFAKDRTGERKGDRMDERRDGGIVS
jgi:hypothetical protein